MRTRLWGLWYGHQLTASIKANEHSIFPHQYSTLRVIVAAPVNDGCFNSFLPSPKRPHSSKRVANTTPAFNIIPSWHPNNYTNYVRSAHKATKVILKVTHKQGSIIYGRCCVERGIIVWWEKLEGPFSQEELLPQGPFNIERKEVSLWLFIYLFLKKKATCMPHLHCGLSQQGIVTEDKSTLNTYLNNMA